MGGPGGRLAVAQGKDASGLDQGGGSGGKLLGSGICGMKQLRFLDIPCGGYEKEMRQGFGRSKGKE